MRYVDVIGKVRSISKLSGDGDGGKIEGLVYNAAPPGLVYSAAPPTKPKGWIGGVCVVVGKGMAAA